MWEALAEYARWSPLPHNVQPWQLRARSETEADLFYVPARLLPAEDPLGRFVMVALGIFVENLAVAARARGFDVEAEYADVPVLDSTSSRPALFARLRLVESADGDDFDRELIVRRRTSRVAYDGRVVPEPVLAELTEICSSYGNRLVSSSDSELISWVPCAQSRRALEDMTNAKTRREVGSWLRFSERDAARRKDGFSPACLGFPGWLLYLFFHYRGVFELPGLRQAVRRLYSRTMRGTRTIVWLVGPFDGPDDLGAFGPPLRAPLARAHAGRALPPSLRLHHHQRARERAAARPSRARSGPRDTVVHHAGRGECGAAAQRAPAREEILLR